MRHPRLKGENGTAVRVRLLLVLVLCVVLGTTGCLRSGERTLAPEIQAVLNAPEGPPFYTEETEEQALHLAEELDGPKAQQLSGWTALKPGLQDSLAYVSLHEEEQVAVAHGDMAVTWGEIASSLRKLLALLPRLDAEPRLLGQNFRWIRLTKEASFSGYYEPVLNASHVQNKTYSRPLYRVPPDLQHVDLGLFQPDLTGKELVYRVKSGKAVPYFTRAELDGLDGKRGVLRGKGLELAWVDPIDAYFLHVQGSGRLRFPNGKEESIHYAANNGHPYFSIGKYLAGMGVFPSGKSSMQELRHWLHEHPSEQDTVFRRNARYIFFKKMNAASGPIGSMNYPVIPMVSLAVDPETFPLGALLAFDVALPDPTTGFPQSQGKNDFAQKETPRLRGLGLANDTGAAIRGNRIDLFCGRGDRAAALAGYLNTPGSVWLLLAK